MTLPAPGLLSHHHILIEGRDSSTNPLLLLHGSGGCEQDLLPLAAAVAANSPAIAIRGSEPWEDGFAFFRRFEDRSIDEENLVANAVSLAGFIEAACANYRFSKLPIAVGYSNGAIMSAALLLTRPGLLAGAILFRPLSPFAQYAMRPLNGVPVLMIDGEHDKRRLPGDGHRLATRLMDANACVEHHVLQTGHNISTEDRSLAEHWLKRFQ
jgi:phospholipase/carboxylesterase